METTVAVLTTLGKLLSLTVVIGYGLPILVRTRKGAPTPAWQGLTVAAAIALLLLLKGWL